MSRPVLRFRAMVAGTVVLLLVLAAVGPLLAHLARDRFDHREHRDLFPSCESCHAGIRQAEAPDEPGVWPRAESCAACHDGTVRERVEWVPPPPPRTNLRFTHPMHARAVSEERSDSALRCRECHSEMGADRMQVELAVVDNCLACHQAGPSHFEAPDSACATCHVPLGEAVRLTAADVADFPRPRSHDRDDFPGRGHGRLAQAGPRPIAASCATCHARNYCVECHVDAPEVAAIQALAPDSRARARPDRVEAPPDHSDRDFMTKHGGLAGDGARRCATCHTQESCLTCHIGTPRVAGALPVSSPGRGRGALTERRRPASHGADFSENHGSPAAAAARTCAACHARAECLDCHRPNPGDAPPGYHPSGFLAVHPAQAYQGQSTCTDCHSQGQFCAACHASAGLATTELPLDAGYHDAKRFFLAGHGQAARQNLASCVSCHAERDCMSCHATATQGGRNFDPHGPGFDAERLRRRNPQMCTACHGAAIPGAE